MIRLDLTGTAAEPVPVTRGVLRQATSCRHSAALRGFASSPHLGGQGNVVDIVGMFGPENRVHDVDRYRVIVRNGVCRIEPHSNREVAPTTNRFHDIRPNHGEFDRTILLLLESPHKDEYRCGDPCYRIAPAQGRTGTNIELYLERILNDLPVTDSSDITYRVIIANPVQFQTSLWTIHEGSLAKWRQLRDAIWKTLWDVCEIQQDFCSRLQSYCPDVVLNCCTSRLSKRVTAYLCQCGLAARTYVAYHPSYWNRSIRLRCHDED